MDDDFEGDDGGDIGDYVRDWDVVADDALARMLSGAWRSWSSGRPEPRALYGQLLDIVRNTPEGRAGRPADAVGVTARTWNNWLMYARGVTDKRGRRLGTKPSAASQEKIARAVRSARVAEGPTPTTVVITAVVVWNRYQNGRQDKLTAQQEVDLQKVRRVRFGPGLDLDASRAAWEDFRDLQSAQELLDALASFYGVPIELYEPVSIELED